MDKKRKEALERVFSLTSENLNKIYKTLLTGTMVKLEQTDKYDLMKGVHLRVFLMVYGKKVWLNYQVGKTLYLLWV